MNGRIYMPHAGHFIGGNSCSFHLNTYLPTGYIVSTVGEYRPSVNFAAAGRGKIVPRRDSDPPEPLGAGPNSLYETMVFRAVAAKDQCCPWRQADGSDLDGERYATSDAAAAGHEAMCRKWEKPR